MCLTIYGNEPTYIKIEIITLDKYINELLGSVGSTQDPTTPFIAVIGILVVIVVVLITIIAVGVVILRYTVT